MNTLVVGCGRWGSFIAWYLNYIGQNVVLYGRESSEKFNTIRDTRFNGTVRFDERIELTSDLDYALKKSDYIFISVGTQKLRGFLEQLKAFEGVAEKKIILCMKGLEQNSGLRLTEIVKDVLGTDENTAVWVGPGHVQDFLAGIPNCMVIDSVNKELIGFLIENLTGKLIRFYKGSDIIGTEIGSATKNVIGIAAGMLDGEGYQSLKGALMARAPREIAKLIEAAGGQGISAYGLCHLGDYEATLFSQYSHNRQFGEAFVKKESVSGLCEGVYTVLGVKKLAEKYNIDMPICKLVYDVIYDGANIYEQFDNLFLRSIKQEF